ncbi:putative aspartic peptidase domain-containing protein [Lupinus albus]|uniref:Putative aspartic peptidase domain-containing protein n=1 Tax=Lupinus albus TaxID=3870 RepID=A0A6A4PUT3_LUPAL|nr:putative aspartic peptidase domain-containing protein [Lupinus albus]
MSGAEASGADGLIKGNCMVAGIPLLVLFDSGATHSFVSIECVDRLKLQTESLPFDLVVSTPTDVSVVVSTVVSQCPVVVNGRIFTVDLICLLLSQLDLILGMDWLSANHVVPNCADKAVVFGNLDEISDEVSTMKPLSAKEVRTSCKEGGVVFMLLASLESIEKPKIEDIPIVREFPEVFPGDIPELLLVREVEFSINLVPGTGPISIAPYRMVPLELAELKKQVEDLLAKKFIRPSVSPWVEQSFN